ncbi:CoA-transferase [Blastomyces dermatitidis ER-3]|uniref:CoA-transferase n=1 Tax=Ajellomyces dermatitidis (strain ER-3 / ATCC MYA-2586) TaxID=559297 RepID=A0ABP2F399_AJEDR|nr:CoA-transferase [Blastomyces dermatitidis ER-3]EEQ89495.1 CoA-transferase [Blastomyces dermatitidis ER-3]
MGFFHSQRTSLRFTLARKGLTHRANVSRYQQAPYLPQKFYSSTTSPDGGKGDSFGALHGFKILDLTRVLAGPFCTQILADYGADVIKVEQPGKGDDTRYWRTEGEGEKWQTDAISCYFACVNRNKRSVALNLKSQKGREILLDLVKVLDVVVENFVPGKMDELGIGYDVLSKINPAVIHASISGYGAAGPYAQRAGYDIIAAAEGGLLHITGEADGPPTKPGIGLTDLCTGLYMHGAIMAALQARHRTGKGQKLDGSLFETQLSLLINVASSWLNMGQEAQRWGTAHPSIVPYEGFKTKDSYLVLGATNNRQFGVLAERMGRPDLATDERFLTNDSRVRNRSELNNILYDLFKTKTTDEWLDVYENSGIPYGPINSLERVFTHTQTHAREMVKSIDFDAAVDGIFKVVGFPVKFSNTEASVRSNPPLLGEHTDDVLKELGLSQEKLADLRREKVI